MVIDNRVENESKEISFFKQERGFHLEGIDVKKALQRLSIDKATFILILRIFDSTYSSIVSKIKKILVDDKIEEARKLLHTLEGAAANINADGVQLATYELREAVKSGEKNFKPLIDHLDDRLKIVLKSIRSLDEHSKGK